MKKRETLIPVMRPHMPSQADYMEIAASIWDRCWLTNRGPLVQQLEADLTGRLKVPHAITFANGHLALDCLLRAMGLTEGEVITTPYTFLSTTNAITMNGLTPVFCDVKAGDYTMDETKLEALITEKTRAILAVHVYGFPCADAAIRRIADKHGLKVLYDAAHAFGVEVDGTGIGAMGDASMFSLHATKVFNSVEGGLVTYHDEALTDRLCSAQNFGLVGQEAAETASLNAKLSEFHAAMGLANLKIIDEQMTRRGELVEHYRLRLAEIDELQVTGWDDPTVKYNYAYLPVCVSPSAPVCRDELTVRLLNEYNVQARKYFYPLTSDFACHWARYSGDTPVARDLSRRIMTLPLYTDLSHDEVDYVCDALKAIYTK